MTLRGRIPGKKDHGDPVTCRKGLKRLSADRIALLEKLRGWTWNAKVGKTSKTDATGIQARPKKRRLSEADTSNEAIGEARPVPTLRRISRTTTPRATRPTGTTS